mmetsp:Transcript_12142/g.34235  ORF Transcript_12142/g.34235 Transcript_12142/m.34235 type:complete len:97 (-) Transcript_12142:106-396(-)|eukprot:CAMPEP_0119136918 /NCGR_PEP_ID=MMETSP1310-20130426/22433_1 /TAXON_ID=464262 /ORGANISM="Genus nov. species nov., Strain RCC2339" /LENGTH=96 /DNA_ID=CAMNT_0007127957 /DNA_START=110 /DNA_END=400 /DNA_ORIENTATION=+
MSDDHKRKRGEDEIEGLWGDAKKAKVETDGPPYALSAMRQVDVSEFKGKKLVNIREYYNDKETGERKPGRKGISLTKEQWEKLKAAIEGIDRALEE